MGSPENYFGVDNFDVEHAYPSQSLINFALQNQGKSLILEGVTTFNHEILKLKIIFGTSRCQIRKIYYPKRLYTWGEVWEQPATCRALVGLYFLLKISSSTGYLQVASGASHLWKRRR